MTYKIEENEFHGEMTTQLIIRGNGETAGVCRYIATDRYTEDIENEWHRLMKTFGYTEEGE